MTHLKSGFLNLLHERGFFNQCTNEEGYDAYLAECEKTGTPAVAYLGSDPTADSLHIGHLVPVMLMRWFQKYGHKPLMLVGGATARIGDPSGKDKLRPFLTEEAIRQNSDGLRKCYQSFIRFDDTPTGAVMVDNYEWFKDVGYLDFLRDIGTYYTVNRMLTMDSVQTRLAREQPMSFLEFNYQLLQGYDFCQLYKRFGCRAQMAGADQWGNITSGTELGRRKYDVELFGYTSPLLLDSTGKKMGKSEGNAVWVREDKLPAYDYYQYFRNIGDADVGKCLRVFTELPMDEVRRLESLRDKEINEAKKILAFEATRICRGLSAAEAAAETARKTFEEGVAGGDLPTVETDGDIALTEALFRLNLVSSKGEAKRLIAQNGVKIDDSPVSGDNVVLTKNAGGKIKLSVGKKKHGLVVFR